MKKLFTLVALAACSLTVMATQYGGRLQLQINGEDAATQNANILIEKQENGKFTLSLRNFILENEETQLPVGNVTLKDVDAAVSGNDTVMHSLQTIQLEAGDNSQLVWLGPNIPAVDVDVNALISDGNLNAVITIDAMSTLKMKIRVDFGSGTYQMGNSGFEDFHEAKIYQVKVGDSGKLEWDYSTQPATSQEPDYWHSFMSASGYDKKGENKINIVYLAGYAPHTFESDDVRPGSTGKKSLLLKSMDIYGTVANGTITSGRLNAAAINVAEDAKGEWLNHSWNDMSQTELGQDGKPFYAAIDGRPDSIAVWVKFKQQSPEKTKDYPYASVSAILNDGTYYQEPEPVGSSYNNVLAKAADRKIAVTDGEWVRLSIPFDYETYKANNAKGRAMLVTASTNAEAAKGSGGDELYLDDMTLVYNNKLASVKFKGCDVTGFDKNKGEYILLVKGELNVDDIEAVADGYGAYVIKTVDNETDSENHLVKAVAKVIVISGDLSSATTYKFNVTYDPTSVGTVVEAAGNTVVATYDLQGRRVKNVGTDGTYIVKTKSGKTYKVEKK